MGRPPVDDPDAWLTPSEWETDAERLCYPLTARVQHGERVSRDALDACQAEALSRIARRTTAAPTLRWEDVSAIPEPFMLPEERARFAELAGTPAPHRPTYEERRADQREHAARRHDVRWLRPAWSAAYCTYADMSARAKRAGNGKDRDYTRSMKTLVGRLHELGVAPLSCGDAQTLEVLRCMANGAGCAPDVLGVVALVPPIYP